MGRFIGKILITAVAVLIATYILGGVTIDNMLTSIIVALVLGLLNTFIKPILIFLTIPITLLTLGIFLLVINILIIKWTSDIVAGFNVDGWFTALLFSFIVSLVSSVMEGLISQPEKND